MRTAVTLSDFKKIVPENIKKKIHPEETNKQKKQSEKSLESLR